MKPALSGGANWPPSSYNPANGHLYVCAEDRVGNYQAEEIDDARPETGDLYAAGIFGGTRMPHLGTLTALDMHTNKIVWQQQWAEPCYSGTVNSAGGLVFVGRNDGRLTALDSSNGELLWEFQTGAGMNSTVSIFEHDGTQYVAAYSAGNLFAGSPKGDSVWLFSLDGELEPAPVASSVMILTEAAQGETDLANGELVYASACLFCHGETAEGGHGGGPSLAELASVGAAIQVITEGRGDMPPFAGALSPEQIRDVAWFVIESLNE
jgi:alcohol dehydrogenase (cytochrome c)